MNYSLYTDRGETYKLDAQGRIFGGPNHISAPSDSWRAVKLIHVVKTRWILDIVHVLTTSDGWEIYKRNERFKNGCSQWTLVDNDHGTTRIWASERVTLRRTE
jgi:hypothetical protein